MSTAEQKRKKRAERRPAIVVTDDGLVWNLVKPNCVEHKEPDEEDALQTVDVVSYCYRMVCSCGRVRYTRPNSIYEVTRCRYCQASHRLAVKRATR